MSYKFKCLNTFDEPNRICMVFDEKLRENFEFPFRVRMKTKVIWPLEDSFEVILNSIKETAEPFFTAESGDK